MSYTPKIAPRTLTCSLLRSRSVESGRPDGILDRERGIADFPVFALAPDPDAAAIPFLVIASCSSTMIDPAARSAAIASSLPTQK